MRAKPPWTAFLFIIARYPNALFFVKNLPYMITCIEAKKRNLNNDNFLYC